MGGNTILTSASTIAVLLIVIVKFDAPLFGNLVNSTFLSCPSSRVKSISKLSVAETGTSLQVAEAPMFVHCFFSGWSSGMRFCSSKAIPSSKKLRLFKSSELLSRFPSVIASLVSISATHIGPTALTASLSSVEIHELFPPWNPSNNPSKSFLTLAALDALAKAVASY